MTRRGGGGGGERVLETQLSFEEEFSEYAQRQDSDTMLTDSEETYCSELDTATADSQSKVFMHLSHSRLVLKFRQNDRPVGSQPRKSRISVHFVKYKILYHGLPASFLTFVQKCLKKIM